MSSKSKIAINCNQVLLNKINRVLLIKELNYKLQYIFNYYCLKLFIITPLTYHFKKSNSILGTSNPFAICNQGPAIGIEFSYSRLTQKIRRSYDSIYFV